VLGALILVAILLIAIPVSVLMTGGAVAALLGRSLKDNGEATHEGSELIDLS
jgi:hypothetical protein